MNGTKATPTSFVVHSAKRTSSTLFSLSLQSQQHVITTSQTNRSIKPNQTYFRALLLFPAIAQLVCNSLLRERKIKQQKMAKEHNETVEAKRKRPKFATRKYAQKIGRPVVVVINVSFVKYRSWAILHRDKDRHGETAICLTNNHVFVCNACMH